MKLNKKEKQLVLKYVFKFLLGALLNIWFFNFFIILIFIYRASVFMNNDLKFIYLAIIFFMFLFNLKQYKNDLDNLRIIIDKDFKKEIIKLGG